MRTNASYLSTEVQKAHLLQQPFPDGDSLDGESAFCYMLLVITDDDDGSLQGEGLVKRDEVSDFTMAGILVIDTEGACTVSLEMRFLSDFVLVEEKVNSPTAN